MKINELEGLAMKKSTKKVQEEKVVKRQAQEERNQAKTDSEELQEQEETLNLEQILKKEDLIQHQSSQPKETGKQDHSKVQKEEKENRPKMTKQIDWSMLKATQSKATEKISGEEGKCTIVNCLKNGNKRIAVVREVLMNIGNPEEVEVGIMPNGLAIGEKLPIEAHTFPVRTLGAKKVLYAGGLVAEVTKEFNLDYSKRTSITFQEVLYDEVNSHMIALITIK